MREKEIKNRCILLLFVFQCFSQKYGEMIKGFFFTSWKNKNLFHFLEKFRQSKQGCKFLLLSEARVSD
jgi:hypothetical protein